MSATQSKEISFKKHHEGNIKVHKYHVRGGTYEGFSIFNLTIARYVQLKYNVEYSIETHFTDLTLYVAVIRKKRNILRVIIISDYNNVLLTSFVDYGNKTASPRILPEQFCDDEYEVTFPSKIINNPENVFMKQGCLKLRFVFELQAKATRSLYPVTGLDIWKSDSRCHAILMGRSVVDETRDVISNSLRKFFLKERKFGDFVIQVNSNTTPFHVQKALLAARSKFFYEYFNDGDEGKNEIKLNTSREVVHRVLEFLYCGRMKPLDENEMFDVFELANKLRIASLVKLCTGFFTKNMDFFNVQRIRMAGKKFGVEALVKAADLYLRKCKDVIAPFTNMDER